VLQEWLYPDTDSLATKSATERSLRMATVDIGTPPSRVPSSRDLSSSLCLSLWKEQYSRSLTGPIGIHPSPLEPRVTIGTTSVPIRYLYREL
jgi:hypothetical protein